MNTQFSFHFKDMLILKQNKTTEILSSSFKMCTLVTSSSDEGARGQLFTLSLQGQFGDKCQGRKKKKKFMPSTKKLGICSKGIISKDGKILRTNVGRSIMYSIKN